MRNSYLTATATWILITWLTMRLSICANLTEETIADYTGTEEKDASQNWTYKQTVVWQFFQNLDTQIHENEKSCCFQPDGKCCEETKYFIHTKLINTTNETCLISLQPSLNITATGIYWTENSYQIINHCPNKFDRDEDQPNHCVDNLSNLLSPDVHPVISLETNVTYINPHCAACNTQNESLIFWQKMLWCHSLNQANYQLRRLLSSEQEYHDKEPYPCLINHTPPNNVEVQGKQCQPTSTAASYLYELYSNLQARFHPTPISYLYTPVQCRKQKNHHDESNCPPTNEEIENALVKRFEEVVEIHVDEQFLNYKYEIQNQPWDVNDKPGNCPTGFFRNKFLKPCMKRMCGPVKVWHKGRCIFPFTKIKGPMLMYHMNFHFNTLDFNDTIKMKAYHTGNLAVHGFYRANITKSTNSCSDSTRVYLQDMGDTVTFQMKLGKATEYFFNIEEEYARFQTTFKKMSKNFNTSLILSDNFLPLRYWPSFPKYPEIGKKCPKNIAMSELLFCDGALFAGSFTLSSQENLIINDQISFQPTEYLKYYKLSYPTKKYFVCESLLTQKIKRMKLTQDSVVRETVARNGNGPVKSVTFFVSISFSLMIQTIHYFTCV